jgi:chromosome segregation ATPase
MVTPIPIEPNATLARSATTVLDRRKAIRVDLQRERGRADQAEARADRAEQAREAERTRMDALRDQVDGLQAQLAQVRAGAETIERTVREALTRAEAEARQLRQADQERRRLGLVARLRAAWRGA